MHNPFEQYLDIDLSPALLDHFEKQRKICSMLYDLLHELPPSRERSTAATKLEEFAMWANRAVFAEPFT